MMNNTTKNNHVEDELDAVRLALYEETRGMTASEVTAYIKKQIAPTVEKYNIQSYATTKSMFRS
ncbi:MAG: hypothetical protein LBK56_00095 [Gracilibacteraceae bacterium]|jgi:hypothetical protein|nr:hypothetical protein [Gracilibacteraceae bacterium]